MSNSIGTARMASIHMPTSHLMARLSSRRSHPRAIPRGKVKTAATTPMLNVVPAASRSWLTIERPRK